MILTFILLLIFFGFIGGVLYLFFILLIRRLIKLGKLSSGRTRQISTAVILAIVILSAVQTYFAYHPTDNFYLEELESVILRESPSSAKVVKKISTYPDFHGDYTSCSLIELSKADYLKFYNDLLSDKEFIQIG